MSAPAGSQGVEDGADVGPAYGIMCLFHCFLLSAALVREAFPARSFPRLAELVLRTSRLSVPLLAACGITV